MIKDLPNGFIFFPGILLLLFIAMFLLPVAGLAEAEVFRVEDLFDKMEKNTDNIQAMSALVELKNSAASKQVTLSVKNPDKFAIVFADSTVSAHFNGQRLWIHVKTINEVFYHFADSQVFSASYFSLINPKKIFTNLTRKTLFSLFNISPVSQEKDKDGSTLFTMKFVPRMKSVFKQIFNVGYYVMVFSDKNYLPVVVVEFDQSDKERGRLIVLEYRLNQEIADEEFNFVPPEGVVMVPITVVLAQKIEEYARSVVDRIGQAAESLKRSLLDWSF